MANNKRLGDKTIEKIAAGNPAKKTITRVRMNTTKKTAPKSDKTVDFNEAAHYEREAKKPTKAPKAKPAVAAKSALAAHNEGKAALLKPKRTVSLAGTTRLSDVPDHEVYGVEELRAKLAEFPRGAIFTVSPAAPFICVFNLRGRLIGRIKDGPKQKKAKAARADKL
jgi:hypothetical protein